MLALRCARGKPLIKSIPSAPLARIRNDYDGDVEKLKRAEPWLFARHMADASGTTGLPNAGNAFDEGKAARD